MVVWCFLSSFFWTRNKPSVDTDNELMIKMWPVELTSRRHLMLRFSSNPPCFVSWLVKASYVIAPLLSGSASSNMARVKSSIYEVKPVSINTLMASIVLNSKIQWTQFWPECLKISFRFHPCKLSSHAAALHVESNRRRQDHRLWTEIWFYFLKIDRKTDALRPWTLEVWSFRNYLCQIFEKLVRWKTAKWQ